MSEFSHQENQTINKKTTPKQGGGAMLHKYYINRQVGTQKRRKNFGTDKRKDIGREKITVGLCSVKISMKKTCEINQLEPPHAMDPSNHMKNPV